MTLARQQELQELEARADAVVRDMVKCALHGRPPTPEELQSWVHRLCRSSFTVLAGPRDVEDGRPLTIDAIVTITRADVETSCCVPHAINPVVGRTMDGLFESMEKALWRLPKGAYPHRRQPKH